jgi:secreted PhoX family phosphatase
MVHGMDGTSWEVPRLGKFSWENNVANAGAGEKTVVLGTDDAGGGQLYVYVGAKTTTGSPIDKAGLTNGVLYGVRVTGQPLESVAAGIPDGAFDLAPFGNAENMTGAALQAASVAAGVTGFQRPEDASWDPNNPNDLYFVTTSSFSTPSRLWRLRFANIARPELGGRIETLLNGSEGQHMFDNITVDHTGHVYLQEDAGGNDHIGKVWRYDIATDTAVIVAQHNPTFFQPGSTSFLTNDEEASGIIDMSDILGPGWFLQDVQAHFGIAGELVQGGQLLAMFDPASMP